MTARSTFALGAMLCGFVACGAVGFAAAQSASFPPVHSSTSVIQPDTPRRLQSETTQALITPEEFEGRKGMPIRMPPEQIEGVSMRSTSGAVPPPRVTV